MATLATLVAAKPAAGAGAPIPWAGTTGDWRFAVEIAAVDPTAAAWSLAVWGDDTGAPGDNWGTEDLGVDWVDVTGDVTGLEWRRGGDEPYGRTRTGTGVVTLRNSTQRYSPWAATPAGAFVASQRLLAPGMVVRWGYHRPADATPTGWRPQFCGLVEHWDTETDALDRSRWATIPLVETVAQLAGIDEPERAPVGAGDTLAVRLPRLLAEAETGWPFGWLYYVDALMPPETLQATTMAGNRLGECHLTTDSLSGERPIEFRSDRQGRAVVALVATAGNPRWNAPVEASETDPPPAIAVFAPELALTAAQAALVPAGRTPVVCRYPADALRRRATADAVINWVSIAAAGRAAFVAEDPESRQARGRRTHQRHDLICSLDVIPAAQAARIIIERSQSLHTLAPLTVQAADSPGNFDAVTVTDAADAVVVVDHEPTAAALLSRVLAVSHRIRPHYGHEGHRHEATFELDTLTEIEAA